MALLKRFPVNEERLGKRPVNLDSGLHQVLDGVLEVVRLVDHVGGAETPHPAIPLGVNQLVEDQE